MDNFGVVEVATERRTVAPGWAYVPDGPLSLAGGPAGAAAAAAAAKAAASASAAAAAAAEASASAAVAGASDAPGASTAAKPRKRAARSSQATGGSVFTRLSDLTARQEAKLRRELEVLDRDPGVVGGQDGAIPIPARVSKAQNKYTPNVRKILASQKTFANYLSDFHALHDRNGNHGSGYYAYGHGDSGGGEAGAGARASSGASRRPAKKDAKRDAKKEAVVVKKQTKVEAPVKTTTAREPPKRGSRRSAAAAAAAAEAAAAAANSVDADTPMADAAEDPTPKTEETEADGTRTGPAAPSATAAPVVAVPNPSAILLPYTGPRPPPHPLDNDPLLASCMPPLPSDDVLRALVAAPPLTYDEARASWDPPPPLLVPAGTAAVADGLRTPDPQATDGPSRSATPNTAATPAPLVALVPPPPPAPERRYPARVFCEICGYWGRVKCTKCGTPVCALDCLELHREDCVTRYGY